LSATKDGEDYSWDAIWDSEVSITDFGWVEMKIPYAASMFFLMLKNKPKKLYARNKTRCPKYTWNRVDNKIGTVVAHRNEGIENTHQHVYSLSYTSFYYQKK
jgi:hypothetical protein